MNIYAKVIYLHKEGLSIRKIAEVLGDDIMSSDLPPEWITSPLRAVHMVIGNEIAEHKKQGEYSEFVPIEKRFNKYHNQKIVSNT